MFVCLFAGLLVCLSVCVGVFRVRVSSVACLFVCLSVCSFVCACVLDGLFDGVFACSIDCVIGGVFV